MDFKEKLLSRHKLGLTIQKIIEENKSRKDVKLVTSLRKLAASSGVEYSIIQKISSGKKDPQWTTVLSLAEGFGLSVSELCQYYDLISDQSAQNQIQLSKSKKKSKWLYVYSCAIESVEKFFISSKMHLA